MTEDEFHAYTEARGQPDNRSIREPSVIAFNPQAVDSRPSSSSATTLYVRPDEVNASARASLEQSIERALAESRQLRLRHGLLEENPKDEQDDEEDRAG